jgi:hypothetical protein
MPITGPAVELVVRHALALDPAAVGEAVAVLAAEPLLAAQRLRIAPRLLRLLVAHGGSVLCYSLTEPVRPDT